LNYTKYKYKNKYKFKNEHIIPNYIFIFYLKLLSHMLKIFLIRLSRDSTTMLVYVNKI